MTRQNLQTINLKKNKKKLEDNLKSQEDALVAEDAAEILKTADALGELESDLTDLSAYKDENKKHGIAITLPEGCESEDDCDYICDKFIGFNGVQDEATDLTELTVDNLNDVAPIAIA